MLKKASEVIASGNVRSVVDYAIEANRQQTSAKRELDEAKAHLRKVAGQTRSKKAGRVELQGTLGLATVMFSSDEAQVTAQGIEELEAALSPETFKLLFVRQTTIMPVREIAGLLESLSATEREVVNRYVQIKPVTPKVYLTQ